MKTKIQFSVFLVICCLAAFQFGMAHKGQYDEVARAEERLEKQKQKENPTPSKNNPAKGFAEGVKEATVDSTKDFLSTTADETRDEAPVVGTLEGAKDGGSKAVETAAKGVFKVATFGYGDPSTMKVEEPEKDSQDVTKFKFKL